MVDSFELSVDEAASRDTVVKKKVNEVRDTAVKHAAENAKPYLEGGILPQKSSRQIKALLLIAVTNLLDRCCKTFGDEARQYGTHVKTELSVALTESKENRLKNVNREHTIAIGVPSNGHHFIGLTIHASTEYICGLMELVNDCYISPSKHPESCVMCFRAQGRLMHVNESDEEHWERFRVSWNECQQELLGTSCFEENKEL